MKHIFKEAVKNYLESIEATFDECKSNPKRGLVSKIEITGDENYDIFIVIPKKKLDYVANLWFGDSEDYDEKDLLEEITNLIVGNAKMIGEGRGINFEISLPKFIGEYQKLEYNDILKFKFKNRCFYIILTQKEDIKGKRIG